MPDEPRSTGLLLASGFFIALGLLIASLGKGIGHGSIPGALVAVIGTIPAGWALWQGAQKKTQGTLLLGMLLLLGALGVAALLIVLRFVAWLR